VEHPDTLTSMNNLSYTWKRQGGKDGSARKRKVIHDTKGFCLGRIAA